MSKYVNDILLSTGKTFLAFVGKRNGATTGEPNPRTGRLSRWGDYYRFATKAERDQFVKEYYHTDNVAFACSFNTGRQFSRGMSLRDYAEHIYSLPCYSPNEPYYQ